MKAWVDQKNFPRGFFIFAGLVFLTIFIFEHINGRFWLNDFRVYYTAARAMLSGQQVYGLPFGESSGFYKYSPFILFFVFPYCLFSFETAAVIHFIVLGACIMGIFLILGKIIPEFIFPGTKGHSFLIFFLAFICVLIHFVKEFHLGNINSILLFWLCLSLYLMLRSGFVLSGICLGIVILTKPFFLILVLPVLFRKQWKTLGGLALLFLAAFILPALVSGWKGDLLLHGQWIRTMMEHNENYPAHQSVFSMIRYYISPDAPNYLQYVVILAGGLLYIMMFAVNLLQERKSGSKPALKNANLIVEWFTLVAVIPDLVKTDSEHFMATLPLFFLVISYIVYRKKFMYIPLLAVLVFFYGGNSNDLLGSRLSDLLYNMALIGISNLLIIALSLYFYYTGIRRSFS